MPSYGSPAHVSASYLFVDGECLNATLEKIGDRYFDGTKPPINWERLRMGHRKAFYYDAVPVQKSDEDDGAHTVRVAPKRAELAEIEKQPGYHVRTGETHHRRRRGNEQKMVDVQLAVDALLMASRGLFGSCTLITGDLDFKPLVTALVDMGVDVHLLYPLRETNEDLKAAADDAAALSIAAIRNWVPTSYAALLPTAQFNFQAPGIVPPGKIAQWHDDGYGDCYVLHEHGVFQLITERSPQNPDTHRLEMASPREATFRAYAEDVFDIRAPAW
jgi:uncharacterized LabA/DUF88 family protein